MARYCEFWMEDNVRSRGWNPLPASPPLTHNFFHFFKGGGGKAPPLVLQGGGGPKFSNGLSWPQSASAGLDLPQQFWGQCGVAADSMLASNCLSYWPPICSLKMSGSLPFCYLQVTLFTYFVSFMIIFNVNFFTIECYFYIHLFYFPNKGIHF